MNRLFPRHVAQNCPDQPDQDIVNDSVAQNFWREAQRQNSDNDAPVFCEFTSKDSSVFSVVLFSERSVVPDCALDSEMVTQDYTERLYFGAILNGVCFAQCVAYVSYGRSVISDKCLDVDINHRRMWIATGLLNSVEWYCKVNNIQFVPSGRYTTLGAHLINAQPRLSVPVSQEYDWPRRYTDKTYALLFGLSLNRCARPGCNNRVIESETHFDKAQVISHIAHIHDCKSGAVRSYVKGMPSKEFINSYDNLLLLCTNDHTIVDRQPNTYTADELRDWKRFHVIKSITTMKSLVPPEFSSIKYIGTNYEIVSRDMIIKEIRPPHSLRSGNKERITQEFWFVGDDGMELGLHLQNPGLVGSTGARISIVGASFGEGQFMPFQGYNHLSKQWVPMHDFFGSLWYSVPRAEFRVFAMLSMVFMFVALVAQIATGTGISLAMLPIILALTIYQFFRHLSVWRSLEAAKKNVRIS